MNLLKLLPVIFSLLLLGAHFSRIGINSLSIIALLFPFLLLFKYPWVPRVIQVVLVLGALEWIRATLMYIDIRIDKGEDWLRLAVIIGVVALFTGLSSLSFRHPSLKKLYRLLS